jgi:hypothetical protein
MTCPMIGSLTLKMPRLGGALIDPIARHCAGFYFLPNRT